jgi:hypothetical protein
MTAPVQTSGLADARIQEFYRRFGVSEHPILHLPPADTVRRLLASESGREELVRLLQKRQQRIRLSEDDPLEWGFEPAPWRDADALLTGRLPAGQPLGQDCNILALFGGNRATKTVYSVKRGLQCARTYPGTNLALCSESELASIETVQKITWQFLQPHYSHLNGKRDPITKINYGQSGGFTDRKIVLPNRSTIYFLTYNQEAGDFEGWEFGAPAFVYADIAAQLAAAGKPVPPNIGAVTDESLPLRWLSMFVRRLKFRKAHVLWPFTPVKGITPAVKELVGKSAQTLESRPSELLPRQNIPDCPEGHMPYIRRCVYPNAMAIYFFTQFNPFGPSPGRSYYDEVKALVEGKASEIVERVAYGFARDSVARAFPKFGAINVVKCSQLPAVGTNYFFCDPAGVRNWFMLWVRVCPGPGGRPRLYIYRDWPDAQTYGEWAVPTEREVNETNRLGWDGDAGPAQNGQGFGVTRYKQTILDAERIRPDRPGGLDPQHARLIERAQARGEPLENLREEIAERYIDPRAAASEHLAEQGGTCIIDEFAAVQVDAGGKVLGPAMDLIPASGVNQEEGFTHVNELLEWNPEQPPIEVLNQPHLFVCEDCQQVRWMFENYTGRAGEKGAAKDPADLCRYLALAKLEHVEQMRKPKAGKGW